MWARFFGAHGEFCASHPWEVIVATLTLTTCMLTLDQQHPAPPPKPSFRFCAGCLNENEYNAADVIVMTIIRCLAVLYVYYQFCKLQKLGSKYILGIAGLFTVFSSFIFTSTVLNILRINVVDLKDALFFFLLLIDLSKAAMLAQFAMNASNQNEVKNNIAKGMALLGPTITLDTIVETLVIGVGTLSGVHRLEMLSCFACLSVLVNYIVFMTFYPACLSLILELSRNTSMYGKNSILSRAFREEDHKSNPVVQRVKLIMSAGLMIVHAHSRWPFREDDTDDIGTLVVEQRMTLNRTEENALHGYIMKWLTLSADHIVILILLLALVVKFIFFENKEDFTEKIKASMSENLDSSDKTEFLKLNQQLKSKYLPETPVFKHSETFFLGRRYSDDKSDSSNEVEFEDKSVQTIYCQLDAEKLSDVPHDEESCRSLDECLAIYNNSDLGAVSLTDEEVVLLVQHKHIPGHQIEKAVDNPERGVKIRRKLLSNEAKLNNILVDLPFKNYDYSKVMGACCENVIGYIPIPVGYAGPLLLDNQELYVPMATTEGCLVASTNRGCRALKQGCLTSRIVGDGMTRGPVVRFPSLPKARIEGRGKSVVCEAVIPSKIVTTVLKTTVTALVDVNYSKNMIGSAIAGSIGGFNAHAANIVTAVFLATGQDPAQNISSSNCMTLMEPSGASGEDLYISCTMPSMEIGTVGGGTVLPPQAACLEVLGVKGANKENPGENASQLARIVCGLVLAGELSLMAALAAGHLVRSHLRHNRSTALLGENTNFDSLKKENFLTPPCKDY
ncbi:unnamed protein product [Psylliodes chrysocephalus]|uniref:3-hydroxy-3-methylglutaryl-coenzyme A reductase n=1 Tax=Psylliodes chrysocephalus TaxID=3402493 RepID=A0A9P0CNR4_9CUCU|nr:unnamed protein product [Psylliodes chrysocephala]